MKIMTKDQMFKLAMNFAECRKRQATMALEAARFAAQSGLDEGCSRSWENAARVASSIAYHCQRRVDFYKRWMI